MKLWKILGVELYEVGDIFINMSGNNPGLRFKGTWELIAQGRTLVGVDTSQSEFNAVRKSGGSKTHTLTVDEMPRHNHKVFRDVGGGTQVNECYGIASAATVYNFKTNFTTVYMENSGKTNTHNNLQPYLTTYIWERVS